ncbi:hypothetical protein BUE93_21375 [Chromobacterium amazonense]|uniref:Uncharacterized protein n=1 Tax=Chromobacterium amazonense TaxID=1382803 RepID=A0A2S9WYQ1_9NEIS|nr:hypothetical protein [Chromobacterium amazonense]PRP68595.1 hypothetical protein BUE93_21375 [Chromobacterium amazonense]
MAAEWQPTAGLAGQVFDGPACYVEAWDIAFQHEVNRILALPSLKSRRAALGQIDQEQGAAMRQRVERALQRKWKR